MTAQIIDGKALASEARETLKKTIAEQHCQPKLAVILVGDDEASLIYDKNKQKAALSVGMACDFFHLAADTREDEVLDLIGRLNAAPEVNGILVQLPLPKHIDKLKILSAILPQKDVDGFSPYNAGLLQSGAETPLVPATPKGVVRMIKSTGIGLKGKHAVIIGRSSIVGRPLASLLLNEDCTVTVVHSKTPDIEQMTRQADILVAACGCPKLVKSSWVKEGAVVLDVGINRSEGKLCGDVDFDDVRERASYISPVPGGVGPMTVAMLLENTYRAFLMQNPLKK